MFDKAETVDICITQKQRKNMEWKFPTAVRRRLSRTHTVLGRAIPGEWVPVSGMKVRSLVVLSNDSAFHRRSA